MSGLPDKEKEIRPFPVEPKPELELVVESVDMVRNK